MSQPHELTAVAQAAAIRRRELSPVDLVEHYLARIEAYDSTLGAFVTRTGDAARARAKAAEVAVTMGEKLPALHGLPVAVKDLTATAGVRTTYGSVPFAEHVPDVDAEVVTLLRRAGTISLGKTATSEFGTTLYTENRLHPPARNPWRADLSPGGSSGGAAVAVAAGLVPVAQGSDGGGSLRVPAALCGLVGFKPSRGLVPGSGDRFGLAVNGPLGRTVQDVAALLSVLAVPPSGVPRPGVPLRPPGRLRIARHLDPPLYDTAVHPECVRAYQQAGALLAELGHEVVDVTGPWSPASLADFRVLQCALVAGRVDVERTDELTAMTRWLVEQGARYTDRDVRAAHERLRSAVRRATDALRGYDLVLTPTLARPRVPIGHFAAMSPERDFDEQTAFSPYCSVYNLSGQPAVSLPVGDTADGLPVGVMLAARRGADALLLAAAAQLQDAVDRGSQHPPIWTERTLRYGETWYTFPLTRGALKL